MNTVTYEERREIYREALHKWGVEHQCNKFDEELGEFLAEYGRMRNGEGGKDSFAEELADLSIMLEQLRLIFDVNDEVCRYMDEKLLRLKGRCARE